MNSTVASDRQRSQATCNAHTDLPHAQHHSESPQMCAPRHPIAPVAPPARYPHTKHRRGSSHTFKSHASAERLTRAAFVAIQAPLQAASAVSMRSRAPPPAPFPRGCAGSSPLRHLGSPQSRRATAASHKGVSMQGAQPPGVPCTPIARAHRQRVEPGSEMAADELRELGLVGRRPSASSCAGLPLRGSDTRRSELGVCARRRVLTRSAHALRSRPDRALSSHGFETGAYSHGTIRRQAHLENASLWPRQQFRSAASADRPSQARPDVADVPAAARTAASAAGKPTRASVHTSAAKASEKPSALRDLEGWAGVFA